MENELYHYGVKGMRWGIRKKYETKGGGYTKSALASYDEQYKKYENATGYQKRIEKDKLKKSRRDLRNNYRADKGRLVYSSGRTIESEKAIRRTAGKVALGASAVGAYAVRLHDKNIIDRQIRDFAVAGSSSVLLGSAFVAAKSTMTISKLRAYYARRYGGEF